MEAVFGACLFIINYFYWIAPFTKCVVTLFCLFWSVLGWNSFWLKLRYQLLFYSGFLLHVILFSTFWYLVCGCLCWIICVSCVLYLVRFSFFDISCQCMSFDWEIENSHMESYWLIPGFVLFLCCWFPQISPFHLAIPLTSAFIYLFWFTEAVIFIGYF